MNPAAAAGQPRFVRPTNDRSSGSNVRLVDARENHCRPGSHSLSLASWRFVGMSATGLAWYDPRGLLLRVGVMDRSLPRRKVTQPWRLP